VDPLMILMAILCVALLIAALMTLITENNFRLILYFAAFSLTAAGLYMLLHAPDIALAEIAVGCAFVPLIYTIAVMKQTTLNVVVKPARAVKASDAAETADGGLTSERLEAFMVEIGRFCELYGLEAKLVGGLEGRETTVAGIFRPSSPDLLIDYDPARDIIQVEGNEHNSMIESLERWLKQTAGVEFVGVGVSEEEEEEG